MNYDNFYTCKYMVEILPDDYEAGNGEIYDVSYFCDKRKRYLSRVYDCIHCDQCEKKGQSNDISNS